MKIEIARKMIVIGIATYLATKIAIWSVPFFLFTEEYLAYASENSKEHLIMMLKLALIFAWGIYLIVMVRKNSSKFLLPGALFLIAMPLYFSYMRAYKVWALGFEFRPDHLIFSFAGELALLACTPAYLIVAWHLYRTRERNA